MKTTRKAAALALALALILSLAACGAQQSSGGLWDLSLIHISEPTRPY